MRIRVKDNKGNSEDFSNVNYDTYERIEKSIGFAETFETIILPDGDEFESIQIAYSMRNEEDGNLDLIQWLEKQLILMALESCNWQQKKAAEKLRISSRNINYRISQYGITHPSWRVNRPESASILAINQEK